jgi:NADH:ubiquinone oxidoreductase subunit B-like Fe-S oxidoreductase
LRVGRRRHAIAALRLNARCRDPAVEARHGRTKRTGDGSLIVGPGSCNGCELQIHALGNPFYGPERFGFRFVASPRHADVLLVTGPVTLNMREALQPTYNATPAPKWVVASGVCAA